MRKAKKKKKKNKSYVYWTQKQISDFCYQNYTLIQVLKNWLPNGDSLFFIQFYHLFKRELSNRLLKRTP